jgi:quinolinate synthase
MARENPDKTFYPAFKPKICSNMKRTALQDILASLTEEKYEITVDPAIAERARNALDQMVKYI